MGVYARLCGRTFARAHALAQAVAAGRVQAQTGL